MHTQTQDINKCFKVRAFALAPNPYHITPTAVVHMSVMRLCISPTGTWMKAKIPGDSWIYKASILGLPLVSVQEMLVERHPFDSWGYCMDPRVSILLTRRTGAGIHIIDYSSIQEFHESSRGSVLSNRLLGARTNRTGVMIKQSKRSPSRIQRYNSTIE